MNTQKATVVSREILHDGVELGTVIEFAVPKKAKRLSFPGQNGESGGSYLHFAYLVKGGAVNIHVKTDDDVQGRKVTGYLQIVKKTMSNGCQYLYLDIVPTPSRVTHWFHIIGSDKEAHENWQVFALDTFIPNICLLPAGDLRPPRSRDVIRHADVPVSNTPFAALAGMK